jgi:hypothetical protein
MIQNSDANWTYQDSRRWNHEFDGFFAFSQQQSRSRQNPDIFQNRRFSTSPVKFHASIRKHGSGYGSDVRKSKLSRQIIGFDSPFRSGETGSVGKQVQDINNVRIVRGLFQRSKFAGQLHGYRNRKKKIRRRRRNHGKF